MADDGVISQVAAAKALGISRERVRQLLAAGRLERVPGGVSEASVARLVYERAQRENPGRPGRPERAWAAKAAAMWPATSLERAVLDEVAAGHGPDEASSALRVHAGTVADVMRWVRAAPGAPPLPEPPPKRRTPRR